MKTQGEPIRTEAAEGGLQNECVHVGQEGWNSQLPDRFDHSGTSRTSLSCDKSVLSVLFHIRLVWRSVSDGPIENEANG